MSTLSAFQKTWMCSEVTCDSGQTSKPREETGRKVVSDTFGRNKTATKAIPDDIWHWKCRKDYQKARYAAEKEGPQGPALFYIRHLRQQLVRVKLWRPDCTFVVQLSQPAAGRLQKYHESLHDSGGDQAAATAAIAVLAKIGRGDRQLPLTAADAVTPAHADHIQTHFAGQERSVDFLIDTVLTWIDGELTQGSMRQMPPVEFLINNPGEGEVVNDPANNFQAWLALQAPPASGVGGSIKRQREDSDNDDDKIEKKAPRKVPRLVALHGPRPRPAERKIGSHTGDEREAAAALLLLGAAPPPSGPFARITIASLLNPVPAMPTRASPRGGTTPRARREPAPLPFWIPPIHQRVVQSIEKDD